MRRRQELARSLGLGRRMPQGGLKTVFGGLSLAVATYLDGAAWIGEWIGDTTR